MFSKLLYCSSVWSNTTQANLDKFQVVQNFACRILCGAEKFDNITPLLKDLRWLPITQQLYFRLAVLVFKCMTSCAPEYLTSKLVRRSRSAVSTRNTNTLNFWTYHSSALPAAKRPFNIERPLYGMSCSLRSNLAHLWRISSAHSGKSFLVTVLFNFINLYLLLSLSCT